MWRRHARYLGQLLDKRLDSSSLGARWQNLKWKSNYLINHRTPVFDTLVNHPHRPIICEAVIDAGAMRSVLEVGCGRGANLLYLARRNGNLALYGTDVSRIAIGSARRELGMRGVTNVKLSVGDIRNLSSFASGSVEVVLADAVFMYIPVVEARSCLRELLRVAKSALVLSTWHLDSTTNETARYDEGTWVYDYRRLVADTGQVAIAPYPTGVWEDARWLRYGSIVTIRHQ